MLFFIFIFTLFSGAIVPGVIFLMSFSDSFLFKYKNANYLNFVSCTLNEFIYYFRNGVHCSLWRLEGFLQGG